ncbi:hypothetical protein LGM38_02285 [Burkholderia vietnamiensis]|uniref:hypothetical protein n=1 Tax=Burkholderia vietnamiensis TaxID=60552 RepID=UPI001CF2F460|nr:hypothetical protein [Burkholderia vietnamiensis]MCA8010893.1 hypothetical protein [Burkholderia vietnamiensis]HDR8937560.1 hypothetical protein [Burkholderia vietnamiensis]HDR9263455.1 hypothetical protein [Burkholderia vietnamiensis]
MEFSISTADYMHRTEFFRLIAGTEKSYSAAVFSFLAVRDDEDTLTLFQGHVQLSAKPNARCGLIVETPSICGASLALSDMGIDCATLENRLRKGGVDTPFGRLRWGTTFGREERELFAYLERFPPDFNQEQAHAFVLTISGTRHLFTNSNARFQNDLRSAATPYDSVADVAGELGLRNVRWDMCVLDISAQPIVSIDTSRTIQGTSATLGLVAPKDTDVTPARLGYRVQSADGKILKRGAIDGADLEWRNCGVLSVGEHQLDVPRGAAIQCFASYNGQWLHQGWITDPLASINARRVIHETFDDELSQTERCFFDRKTRERNGRVVEAGIANLLYMLGFAVDPLAATHMTDGPDVLASTPAGDLIVVECTTGAMQNDGKLSKLLSRLGMVRDRLGSTGNSHIRLVAVMVTTLDFENVTDLKQATDNGVIVLTSENIASLMGRTKSVPDANLLFEEWWQQAQPLESMHGALAQDIASSLLP